MSSLNLESHQLNAVQQSAVEFDGNTVVLAGPGSGKTDTMVVKISRLTRTVSEPQRIACITYGNDAVREFSQRLKGLGLRTSERLFLGTVHSFCLTQIVRPYAALAGLPEMSSPLVLSTGQQLRFIEQVMSQSGLPESPRSFIPTLTRIRRAQALNESVAPFDDRHILAAARYEKILATLSSTDFEGMVLCALRIVRSENFAREMLVARYPWIAIDEYQDLGGPLHQIVLELVAAGCGIFAVGDPDQCIHGFTGANPRYLRELEERPEFNTFRLQFNYRCGSKIISAAETSLGENRGYQSDPSRNDVGEIFFEEIGSSLEEQITYVVQDLLPSLLEAGTPAHEIAILYRGVGPVYDALLSSIASSPLEFLVEKDSRFPSSPLVRWLQRCASRALGSVEADSLYDLLEELDRIFGRFDGHDESLRRLIDLYIALEFAEPSQPCGEWIEGIDRALGITALLTSDSSMSDEIENLASLKASQPDSPTILDFARGVQVNGRVAVTTYHSSKGRQFDVVILPGLQQTIIPYARWFSGAYRSDDTALLEDRRLFYVGLTRARDQVHLLWSSQFTNQWGKVINGPSPFVGEIRHRLATSP